MVRTVAGTGSATNPGTGDGGLATEATLHEPVSVALGPDGSVFIGDAGDNKVRRVDPDGGHHDVRRNGTGDSQSGIPGLRLRSRSVIRAGWP